MDNKLRNKLNNVLKGLILSKEQKKELVEVFEGCSRGNTTIVEAHTNMDSDEKYVILNGVKYEWLNHYALPDIVPLIRVPEELFKELKDTQMVIKHIVDDRYFEDTIFEIGYSITTLGSDMTAPIYRVSMGISAGGSSEPISKIFGIIQG